jgi:hypothetical protein
MAALTASDPSSVTAMVARKAAAHAVGWMGSTYGATQWNTTTATDDPTRKRAALNASLIGAGRRWISSPSVPPTTQARTTSVGEKRNSPRTSGTSLRVNECASRWNWMWTTRTSAR